MNRINLFFSKLSITSGILLAICFLTFESCHKEAKLPSDNLNISENTVMHTFPENCSNCDETQYTFYLDNIQVPSSTYELGDSTLRVHIESGSPTNSTLTSIYAFSNDSLFYAFGNNIGIPFQLYDEMSEYLSEYADSSGVITQTEQSEELPQWFIDFQDSYIEQMLSEGNQSDIIENRILIRTVIYDECESGPLRTLPIGGHPSLWLYKFRDRTTSYYPFGIGSIDIIYDRSFYRSRLATIRSWGLNRICFANWPYTGLNNDANSWIVIGI